MENNQPPPYSETVNPQTKESYAPSSNYPQHFQPYPSNMSQPQAVINVQPPPTTTHNVTVVTQPSTFVTGGCPVCRVGNMSKGFTCCGICCALCCFPCGIICCFAWRRLKCHRCGATI